MSIQPSTTVRHTSRKRLIVWIRLRSPDCDCDAKPWDREMLGNKIYEVCFCCRAARVERALNPKQFPNRLRGSRWRQGRRLERKAQTRGETVATVVNLDTWRGIGCVAEHEQPVVESELEPARQRQFHTAANVGS